MRKITSLIIKKVPPSSRIFLQIINFLKSDYAYVEIGFDFKEADITLYDMGGRQLQSLKTKNKVTKMNTQALIDGDKNQ